MAIKNIIAKGIGFAPGSLKFIPTHGFTIGAAAVIVSGPFNVEATGLWVGGAAVQQAHLAGGDAVQQIIGGAQVGAADV